MQRLQKEMNQVREDRTKLTVALEFARDENVLLSKQMMEVEDKNGKNSSQIV